MSFAETRRARSKLSTTGSKREREPQGVTCHCFGDEYVAQVVHLDRAPAIYPFESHTNRSEPISVFVYVVGPLRGFLLRVMERGGLDVMTDPNRRSDPNQGDKT